MITYKRLEKYNYISFDIFDTLIKRCTNSPADVFTLIENYCNAKEISCPKDFKRLRIEADNIANSKKFGFATLNDIYSEIDVYNADELMNIEIEMEISVCFPNQPYVALFKQCIKEKNTFLISDMYLSHDVITRILDKCDIKDYKGLYISNENMANKVSGDLFRKVAQENGFELNELLHIGDGLKGDFIRPRMIGMKSFWVFKSEHKSEDISAEVIEHSIDLCKKKLNKYEAVGCEVFGPILLGFVKWFDEQVKKDSIDSAYFMSRDGLIVMKAYNTLYPDKLKTEYLYGSRRAFTVPLIWKHCEFEQISEVISFPQRLTVRQFLGRLGFSAENLKDKIDSLGLVADKTYENGSIFKDANVKKLYQYISDELIERSKHEYEALSKYIFSMNFGEKTALIDIGYHGTMQNALNALLQELGINSNVKGYYIGFDNCSTFANKISADGYIFNEANKRFQKVIDSFIPIFEEFFLAQHGTVKYFAEISKIVEPVLDEYEYDILEGKIIDEKQLFKQFSDGAIKFVEMFKNSLVLDSINISPELAMQRMERLGKHPTLNEAIMLGDCRFFDDKIDYIARPSGNIKNMKNEFMTSGWKIGYLKRVFKVPMPYAGIYDIFKKFYNM